MVSFGFIELKINKIEAFTHIQNENSKKLLEKNGFHLIEHKKDDDNLSNVVYQIIKNQQTTKH